MEYRIDKLIFGVKNLDRNALMLYSYILAEKRYTQWKEIDIITFSTILEIIKENSSKLKEEQKLKEFLPILHHTIHLTPEIDIVGAFSQLVTTMNQEKASDEDISVLLQIIHQILKTFTEISGMTVTKFEKCFVETIISWIFSDNKVIQVRAVICALILLRNFDCHEIIDDIWARLKEPQHSYSKAVEILVQLIDFILLEKKIINEKYFWEILIRAFRHQNTTQDMRKQVIFLLKKVVNYLSNSEDREYYSVDDYFEWDSKNAENIRNSWSAFVTILENLEEKQSHLILPSLHTLDKVKVPSLWTEVLFTELLSHRNTLVLKWSVQYVLSTSFCQKMNFEMLKILMEALNNTFLYVGYSFSLGSYKDFFKFNNKLHLLEAFTTINWKPVPIHACFKEIATFVGDRDLIPHSILLELSARIRRVQNKRIREDLRKIYYIAFEEELKKAGLKEFLNIIEALYNSNERISSSAESLLSIKICDLMLEEVNISLHVLQLVFGGSLENKQKEKLLEAFLHFNIALEDLLAIPLMKGFDFSFIPRIHQVLVDRFYSGEPDNTNSNNLNLPALFIAMWSSKVDEEIIDLSLEFIKSDFSTMKNDKSANCSVNKLKEIFVETFTTALISSRNFAIITENVEIFLDKGGHLTIQNIVTALDGSLKIVSSEVLTRIIAETKSLMKKYGYHVLATMCSELTNYLTSLPDDIFHDNVSKLLNLDPFHTGLAATVYLALLNSSRFNMRFYGTINGVNLLSRGLLFGEPLHGDQKIEYDYCETKKLFDLHQFDTNQVRAICLKILYKIAEADLSSLEKQTIFGSIRNHLLETSIQMNRKKPRYFDNSKQHRVKLRIMQALAAIQSIDKVWDERFMDAIFKESNQMSVTFLAELLIADCISKEFLTNLLKKSEHFSSSSLCSLFAITFMVCKKYDDKDFAKDCVKRILPWTMGQHFNTRLYAQITVFHLIKSFQLYDDFTYLNEAIQESLKQGNTEQNLQKLNTVYRFNSLDYCDLLDMENVLVHIPRITNMSSDELYKNVENYLPNIAKNSSLMATVQSFQQNSRSSESEDILIDDVQRKMNPVKTEVDSGLIYFSDDKIKETADNGIVVVASLITKPPNLGGIARTCEVLGIKNLVLGSLKHAENKEFKTLSMTSEKWLRLFEVKPDKLQEFLVEKKLEGYSIVGAEQTSNSVDFTQFKFPVKCVLLLGHEKEGIPANLISLLDFAVEIPQFGMVRSLNVHVTGALFMWEYCKQHLIQKVDK